MSLQLTPTTTSVYQGDVAILNAIHPYEETGTWLYDPSLRIIKETNKELHIEGDSLGSYQISYTVGTETKDAYVYVLESVNKDWIEPEEPDPPALPDTPPDEIEEVVDTIQLADPDYPASKLYKYPNIMKRNARYRGHRESEKVLQDHQEQVYEIRQIYKDVDTLEILKDNTTQSWFLGEGNNSISIKEKGNEGIVKESHIDRLDTNVDTVRGFTDDMIQLSGNSLEEHMVGIYSIKRRLQEIDERIAEAERRYRDYENAYE